MKLTIEHLKLAHLMMCADPDKMGPPPDIDVTDELVAYARHAHDFIDRALAYRFVSIMDNRPLLCPEEPVRAAIAMCLKEGMPPEAMGAFVSGISGVHRGSAPIEAAVGLGQLLKTKVSSKWGSLDPGEVGPVGAAWELTTQAIKAFAESPDYQDILERFSLKE